jgi:hypothetical protein
MRRLWRTAGWPLLVVVVTFLFALVPALLEPEFYVRGDTGAQFAPTWWHLGQLLRGGELPPVFDPDSWAGGNYAAEALFGVYNPLNWLIWLAVSASSDLRVSVTLVKAVVLSLLALGTYLLAREYDAAAWASAAVAVAVPFGGFTLFWDAGSWAAGLIAFAYAPWVWWAFRRVLHGRLNPVWGFVVGALAITQGNPYGTLAVVVIGAGLLLEGLVRRQWRGTAVLAALGVCVAALLPLVYLPLVETVSLAVRSAGEPVMNNGKLRPAPGDLLLLGAPTYVPPIRAITGVMQVPATYFCWFLVPLLPWLRLDGLRRRLPELTAVGVVGLVYLAMTIGPSKLWLFRWPIRLTEYLYLALAVLLALALSRGLARDRLVGRSALTTLLVLLTGYLAWADDPGAWRRAAVGTALVLALSAGALLVHRVVGVRRAWALALVLVVGTGLTVGLQLRVFGENASSRVWHFPTQVDALQDDFADWGDGTAIQFADLKPIQDSGNDARLRAQWSDYLAGSMFHVAGVDAVNNYTGMGLVDFTRSLCMNYDGLARRCGYRAMWSPPEPDRPPLAELMKLSTVVAQPALAEGVPLSEGWRVDPSVSGEAVVVRRETALPWPESRLAWASDGVEVTAARSEGDTEVVTVAQSEPGGRLSFAALGWPGWSATLEGTPLDVDRSATGLLEVVLPADASGEVVVEFAPPGQRLGLVVAAGGALGAVVLGVLVAVRRRPALEH